jgi:peroxiredoxin
VSAPALFLCVAAAAARGAPGSAGQQAADFPPGEFTDAGRYSLADFKGKAVVLYFYEKG